MERLSAILAGLTSPLFLAVYLWLACVLYVHFRGRERLRFGRQLSEHSGIFAPFNVLMYLFSAVPRRPILERERFAQLDPLREHWREIRDEAQGLFDAGHIDYAEHHQDLAFVSFKKRGWKRFYLKWYDDFMPSARALCPRTVELVAGIPDINAAAFTLLPPGTKLGRHRDPFAGSLRYHLGLVTPNSDDCSIWIDGERYSWRDGEDIVFDETYIHWARNDTDRPRIIFFADVTRPLHLAPVRWISRLMNRCVFRAMKSQNMPDDRPGGLNRLTPVVFRIKHGLLALKGRNRQVYYAVKHVLLAGLVYLVFVRSLLDG